MDRRILARADRIIAFDILSRLNYLNEDPFDNRAWPIGIIIHREGEENLRHGLNYLVRRGYISDSFTIDLSSDSKYIEFGLSLTGRGENACNKLNSGICDFFKK